jgi:hypothetical protein
MVHPPAVKDWIGVAAIVATVFAFAVTAGWVHLRPWTTPTSARKRAALWSSLLEPPVWGSLVPGAFSIAASLYGLGLHRWDLIYAALLVGSVAFFVVLWRRAYKRSIPDLRPEITRFVVDAPDGEIAHHAKVTVSVRVSNDGFDSNADAWEVHYYRNHPGDERVCHIPSKLAAGCFARTVSSIDWAGKTARWHTEEASSPCDIANVTKAAVTRAAPVPGFYFGEVREPDVTRAELETAWIQCRDAFGEPRRSLPVVKSNVHYGLVEHLPIVGSTHTPCTPSPHGDHHVEGKNPHER